MPRFKLEEAEAELLLPHPDKIKVLIINIDNAIDNIFLIFMTSKKFFQKILYINFYCSKLYLADLFLG